MLLESGWVWLGMKVGIATGVRSQELGITFTKILLLITLFCAWETTGLESVLSQSSISSLSSSSELVTEDRYDPVEAYYQLRRQYLSSAGGGGSSNSEVGSSSNHPHRRGHHQHNSNPSGRDPSSSHNPDEERGYNDEDRHRCYVCLPPDKGSREARDILSMFPREQNRLSDCASFGQQNSIDYEMPCPPLFGGCILRIHGPNISRACSKYRLDDCKRANSVEFCYCTQPLCNDVKQEPPRLHNLEDEDDDEDSTGYFSGDGSRLNNNRGGEALGTRTEEAHQPDQPPSDSGVVHQEYPVTTSTLANSIPHANFNLVVDEPVSNSCPQYRHIATTPTKRFTVTTALSISIVILNCSLTTLFDKFILLLS